MKFIPQVIRKTTLTWLGIVFLAVVAVDMSGMSTFNWPTNNPVQPASNEASYIVQGKKALQSVSRVGGQLTHDLKIINAVAANLTSVQIEVLKQLNLKLTPNTSLQNDGHAVGQRIYFSPASATQMTNASELHDAGVFGDGVTMVVLDSGVKSMSGLRQDAYGRHRVYGTYNAIENKINQNDDEESGHGTHVASVALNSERDINGNFYGVAPNARLISVKAFDSAGKGNYADVIRGIQWSVYYRERYNIRVMNLSFSTEARSYYWDDPLNQAVMKAWQSGIVVVASAGNRGSSPGGIGVPGNVPYILTVGAVTDAYTPDNLADDRMASFSSSGPTYERFIKPDVVAPGGHLMGLMESKMQLASEHPEFHDGGKYFTMSGTSQAAGVVSGVAALMISLNPSLTPDDVKCRLMTSAKVAKDPEGNLVYSPLQQGAGMVDAVGAVASSVTGCANQGLDISKDLDGSEHYAGPVRMNSEKNYYIEGGSFSSWDGAFDKNIGYSWSTMNDASLWPDADLWRDASLWPDADLWHDASLWPDADLWHDASLWPDTDTDVAINVWVDQE